MKYDITKLIKAADEMLPTLTNPLHRKIIANYRRHAIFETTGHLDRIFTEDMSIPNPTYTLNGVPYEGLTKVKNIYKSLLRTETTVMMLEHERLMVSDWGFASESLFHQFCPGAIALARGAEVDDIDATYIDSHWISMQWPYDEYGRMMGEHVYIGASTFRKCPPDEVITRQEAEDRLFPLLDLVPYPEDYTVVDAGVESVRRQPANA